MPNVFDRRDNETTEQWQVRLILEKLVGGLDVDWSELAALEGFNCTSDHLRRIGKGVELVYKAGLVNDNTNSPAQRVFDQTRIERQQLMDLRREVNEVYRAEARDDLLRQSVITAATMMPPITINRHLYVRPVLEVPQEKILYVLIADTHYGKEMKIRGAYGEVLNEYSPEVFERRMENLYNKIVDMIEAGRYTKLYISHLGDSIDGMLRVNQLMTLRYGIVDSAMKFGEYMAQWLARLSEHAQINYYTTLGNHSEIRPLGSKRGEFKGENIDKMIIWWLKERLKDKNFIKIHEPSHICVESIFGNNVLMIHGDYDKKSSEAAKEYSFLYQVPVTYVVRGHLHSFSVQTVGVNENGFDMYEIQAPSICGIDDLSVEIKKFASAGSVALTFDRDEGLTTIKPIYLE